MCTGVMKIHRDEMGAVTTKRTAMTIVCSIDGPVKFDCIVNVSSLSWLDACEPNISESAHHTLSTKVKR